METESKAPGLVSSWHFFQRSEDTGEIRWQRMGVGRKWRLLEKMEGEKAEVGDPYKVVQGRPTPTLTLPPQIVKCHGNPRYRLSFRGGGGGRKTPPGARKAPSQQTACTETLPSSLPGQVSGGGLGLKNSEKMSSLLPYIASFPGLIRLPLKGSFPASRRKREKTPWGSS